VLGEIIVFVHRIRLCSARVRNDGGMAKKNAAAVALGRPGGPKGGFLMNVVESAAVAA
jgi:hypothetical protein